MRAVVATIPLLAALGCAEPIVPVGGGGPTSVVRQKVVDIPPYMNDAVDLLFVVDNSQEMHQKQLGLELSFERLRAHLAFSPGGMPNLHVGVVSTDLGTGEYEAAGCTEGGDAGRLQGNPADGSCTGPADAFIRDYRATAELRDANYEGGLTETFGCIARLGTDGCRFEQPLEAMRVALDRAHPDNGGFLRDDAILAVVFLTNEDDCSVWNPQMFDPDLEGSGEADKYRCFRHGVQCVGDDVRQEGHFQGCSARADSSYMPHVAEYVDFLLDPTPNGLGKPDPHRQVMVTGMIGDAAYGEVEIHLDGEGEPQLLPACEDTDDKIYPAVRLQSFLDRMALRVQPEVDGFAGSQLSSLCSSKPHNALTQTGREIRKRLGTICMDGLLTDIDPDSAGRQVDCHVKLRYADGRAPKPELPACDKPYDPPSSSTVPCYSIKTGPAHCGDFPTQLALDVYWGPGKSQPSDVYVEGWCLVDTYE